MSEDSSNRLVSLDPDHPIWDRFFLPAPLALIGSREENGSWDLAPKHMVTPLSWENYFGFVCAPSHSTYSNIVREEVFTASFTQAEQVVLASLSAAPRCDDGSKIEVAAIPTLPASTVEGVLVEGSFLMLECALDRIVDGFGRNSLIAGKVVAARVDERALRGEDRDDQDVVAASPPLVYLNPGRFARVTRTDSFPFPKGFRR